MASFNVSILFETPPARQLGHSTTEMLFRVYSRYIPNVTRRDGSAFEAMLEKLNTEELAHE